MRIIDTHSHLFADEFDTDREEVIQRAKDVGVARIYMPNIDDTTIERLLEVCETYKGYCFPLMGLHPTSVTADYKEPLNKVYQCLQSCRNKFVGIGEIGIDLYWDDTFLNQQVKVFETQVRWALELDLPIVIHCRKAMPYIYKVLLPYKETKLRGIFHSFTGEQEEAEMMLEFSRFMIGINGIVTFKKSSIPAILPQIPMQRIVLETDSPYLAPVPHRGRRNESSYIFDTLNKVAEVLKQEPEEVARVTSENALRLFEMGKGG